MTRRKKLHELSAYELHELMCMHGELQVLLNRYKHLEDTNQWKKLARESLAEYDKMQVQYDKMQDYLWDAQGNPY